MASVTGTKPRGFQSKMLEGPPQGGLSVSYEPVDECPWHFGLTPSKYQSGEINRTGAISKCGDEMMRVMLYEAAQSMLTRTTKWS